MAFTDFTYYKGDISIPFTNLNSDSFESEYTDVFEEELLALILGRDLYNDFIAGLTEETPDVKWTKLRDGGEYKITDNGVEYTIKWEGLKNTKKVSLLSYYIYINWMGDNYQQMTALGNSVAKKENADNVGSREKVINAYNKCVKLVGEYPYKSDYYQGVLLPSEIEEELLKKFEPSLINFRYYNKSDYPNWIFRFPDIYHVNIFDI
jgi:hypothetical protein